MFYKRKTGPRSPLVRAKTRCLALWGEIIRREQPTCQYCWRKPTVTAHHIITRQRAIKPFWFDLDYGVGLCWDCHAGRAHGSCVELQIEFREWVVKWLVAKGLNYDKMHTMARARGGSLREGELFIIEKGLKCLNH